MSPEAILLSIRERSGEGSYRFSCPTCLHTVEKPADRKVAALLLSAGVEVDDVDHPEQVEEPAPPLETHAGGPPFSVDDLITFHFLLQDEGRLAGVLQHEGLC